MYLASFFTGRHISPVAGSSGTSCGSVNLHQGLNADATSSWSVESGASHWTWGGGPSLLTDIASMDARRLGSQYTTSAGGMACSCAEWQRDRPPWRAMNKSSRAIGVSYPQECPGMLPEHEFDAAIRSQFRFLRDTMVEPLLVDGLYIRSPCLDLEETSAAQAAVDR